MIKHKGAMNKHMQTEALVGGNVLWLWFYRRQIKLIFRVHEVKNFDRLAMQSTNSNANDTQHNLKCLLVLPGQSRDLKRNSK